MWKPKIIKIETNEPIQMPKGLNNNYPRLTEIISNRTIEVAALLWWKLFRQNEIPSLLAQLEIEFRLWVNWKLFECRSQTDFCTNTTISSEARPEAYRCWHWILEQGENTQNTIRTSTTYTIMQRLVKHPDHWSSVNIVNRVC